MKILKMNIETAHNKNGLKTRDYTIISLLFILFFTFVLRLPTLFEPWGGDQGVYGFIADGILKGKVPYKDMYTNTSYGLYFTYAFFFKLFGNSMAALNIGDLLVSLLTVALVFYLAKSMYGSQIAVISGLLASFFGSGRSFSLLVDMKDAWGTYWQISQRETFMAALFTAGIFIAILADRKKRISPYILVGCLIGFGAVFKITAVGIAFFLAVYLFYAEIIRKDGGGLMLCIYKICTMIVGFILIQLPFLYYFWSHDSLLTMYNAVFVHTALYAQLSRGNILANAFMGNSFILIENLLLWIFSLVSLIYFMVHERKRENILMVIWAIGTVMIILAQGKFFGYHYILIIPPFSILAGFCIQKFIKTKPSWKESFLSAKKDMVLIFCWVFILGNIATFAVRHYDYYRWSLLYATGKITKDTYYQVFNEFPLHCYSFNADYQVANYLKKTATSNASLRTINGGGDTMIHYLSGLELSTRFTSTWYLFNPYLYEHPLTTQLRQELINGIKTEKPDYILLIYFTMDEFLQQYNHKKYHHVTNLMDFISKNYILEKSFDDRRILYKKI